MALTNPIFNLEENLDIYLLSPYDQVANMKSHIEGIVEDDILEELSMINSKWLDFIDIDNIIADPNLELFYIIRLMKEYTITYTDHNDTVQKETFAAGEKLLIPQSLINLNKTTNMQLEPNAYVLEFNYDYTIDEFTDPDEMIEAIKEFVYNQTNKLISLSSRKVALYDEADVDSIATLLNLYYKMEKTEYNLNSIKNVLSSVSNSQVIFSSILNRKIEISLDRNENRKLICVTYNRTKREVREFKY